MIDWIIERLPEAVHVRPLTQEASQRSFFRLELSGKEYVLMLYPEPNPGEIARISHFTELYRKAGVMVPVILQNIGGQALLLEDLGNHYFQYHFRRSRVDGKRRMTERLIRIGRRISSIPPLETPLAHDMERQRFEMDFFVTHFFPESTPRGIREEMRCQLYGVVEKTCAPEVFCHRDFHSRNIIMSNGQCGVVDFQDSMRAHPLYDLASLLWDAYLPWTDSLRSAVVSGIRLPPGMTASDLEMVALQRTIKALGTFAYQIKIRRKLAYRRYVGRVIRSIRQNRQFLSWFPDSLQRCFSLEGLV